MRLGADGSQWKFVGEDTGPGEWYWNPKTGAIAYVIDEKIIELHEVQA